MPTTPPPPPAPGPLPTPEHLLDMARCLDREGQHDPASLRAFHEHVLLGHGQPLATPSGQCLLAVETTTATRYVDPAGQVLDAPPDHAAWTPMDWKDCPAADLRQTRDRARGLLPATGLGLRFRLKIPATELDGPALVEELWGYSCHPYLGKRILADLLAHGERAATVMPALLDQLPTICERFGQLGVEVERCWPMPSRGSREVPEEEARVPMPLSRRSLSP